MDGRFVPIERLAARGILLRREVDLDEKALRLTCGFGVDMVVEMIGD